MNRSMAWLQWRMLQVAKRARRHNARKVGLVHPWGRLHVLGVVPSWVYRDIFWHEIYRPMQPTEPIRRVLDLGANIGLASLYLASLCRSACVEAYEPNPRAFAALEQNVRGRFYGRIVPTRAAISDRDGEVQLTENPASHSSLSTSIVGRDLDAVPKSQINLHWVECVDVAHLLDRPADFVKCDIEGAEYDVLSSASIHPDQVRELVIEFHDIGRNWERFMATLAMLEQRGYVVSGSDRVPIGRSAREYALGACQILRAIDPDVTRGPGRWDRP
jgi:31-O-methyltransferase